MHVLLTSCLKQAAYHAYLIFIAAGDKNIRDLCSRQLPTFIKYNKEFIFVSLLLLFMGQSSPTDFLRIFFINVTMALLWKKNNLRIRLLQRGLNIKRGPCSFHSLLS